MKVSASRAHGLATDTFLTANGTVLDSTPLSNAQLIHTFNGLIDTIEAGNKHRAEVFAMLGGDSVKYKNQSFHPPTQFSPAVHPVQGSWSEETSTNRYVHSPHNPWQNWG